MNKLFRTKWHKIKPHNIRHDVEASRPKSTSDVTLHKDHYRGWITVNVAAKFIINQRHLLECMPSMQLL